jgi:hypothetical protein
MFGWKTVTDQASPEGATNQIIHSISVARMIQLLEQRGFTVQAHKDEEGHQALRIMKLGIDAMVAFFLPIEGTESSYGFVVLNAFSKGVMSAKRVNEVNARGFLPKIYTAPDNTVAELCVPLEAGISEQAVAYYVNSFEKLLLKVQSEAGQPKKQSMS